MADYLVKKFIYKTSTEVYGDPVVEIYADLVEPPLVNYFIKRTVWAKINFTQQSAKDAVQFETELAGVFGPGNNDFYKLEPKPSPPSPVSSSSPPVSSSNSPVSSSIKINYSIVGSFVDQETNKLISGVKLTSKKSTTSKSNGSFLLKGEINSDEKLTLKITKKNYAALNIIPYFGNGDIKPDLGIITLIPIKKSLEQDKISAALFTDKQIKGFKKKIKSPPSLGKFLIKKITKALINLKSKIIPMILTLIAIFGVTQIPQLLAKNKATIPDLKDQIICPTQPEISKLIKRKNKLTKIINALLKLIKVISKFIKTTRKIIKIVQIVLKVLNIAMMFIPSAPAPIPVGIIGKLTLLLKFLKDKIKSILAILDTLIPLLDLLTASINQALQYLKVLDQLIQNCSLENQKEKEKQLSNSLNNSNNQSNNQQSSNLLNNPNNQQSSNSLDDPNNQQLAISSELIELTSQLSGNNPVATNVNGFIMGVETERTDKKLKRRRATATNKQGVIMLRGELSYSSVDQILIDELIFYIEQNDLKAD